MRTIRFDRLEALAEHVTGPNRGHKKFDFSQYNSVSKPQCGTAGCALGEAPVLWPDDWEFDAGGSPRLKEKPRGEIISCAMRWFGLTHQQASHLFLPHYGYKARKGLKHSCTAEQWAEHCRGFIRSLRDRQTPQPLSGAELEEHRMTNFEHGMGYQ